MELQTKRKRVDQSILNEIVQRIVEMTNPEKIILFGSAARGEMGPNSDIDLLVIKRGNIHRRQLAQHIHKGLYGVGEAVDIVVATPEDVDRHGKSFGLVLCSALEEGKVIYAA